MGEGKGEEERNVREEKEKFSHKKCVTANKISPERLLEISPSSIEHVYWPPGFEIEYIYCTHHAHCTYILHM